MESPSQNDVNTLRRKIEELRDIQRSLIEDPETSGLELNKSVEDCVFEIESKLEEILCDASEINFSSYQDLDEFLEHLKNERSSAEAENAKIASEIEGLSMRCVEGYTDLENATERLSCSLELIESQELEQNRLLANFACSIPGENEGNMSNMLEQSEMILKLLQDLESNFNRFEAVEKFEDAFSDLKIVEFEGNCIRLSMRTYIPDLESLLHSQKIHDVVESSEQSHELLIELMDGTRELKHVEIFPNDVYISEITDAAKSFRQVYFPEAVLQNRSSLEWFVRRLQDRIVLCTLRRLLVKSANNARHSFEYDDKEETIVAHMAGGIDAFLKLPQSWPLINSGLTLLTLKSSSHNSKEISLALLCKVAEVANSLDTSSRQTISGFTDRVEEILMQQMGAITST